MGSLIWQNREQGGQTPLIIKLSERFAKYEALWKTGNIKDAISINVGMIEAINCQKQMKTADAALLWKAGDIEALPDSFWDGMGNKETLLWHLLSVAVFATAHYAEEPLPLDQWRADMTSAGIRGIEVDNFFSLLNGNTEVKDGTLFEEATQSLYRIRNKIHSPQELFCIHFRLLNALVSGDWGNYAGPAFCDLVSRQWQFITEHQRFHLLSPASNCSSLLAKCRENDLSGYAKVAAILEAAMIATGVRVSRDGVELLARIKAGKQKGPGSGL